MGEPLPYANPDLQGRAGSILPGWVKLVTCGNANEAELYSAVLAAEGIRSQVFGANINSVDWFWQVFNDVDVIVHESDLERAKEILSRESNNDVEPAEEPADAPPAKDERGRLLVPVAAFSNRGELRDARVVLASQEIDAYVPRMVLRGDRPAGVGKRFVLRVAESDLQRAKTVLAEETEENRDEPRCPKCGSWSAFSTNGILKGLASLVGMGGPRGFECRSCHYRGDESEFLGRGEE